MLKRIMAIAVIVLTAISLAACAIPTPPAAAPGNHVTFIISVFRSINEEELNVPVHATFYLEPSDADLFVIDKNTGKPMTFPFEPPGDPTIPGSWPNSPIEQPMYFDSHEGFVFRVKASLSGEFGLALRCTVFDRRGLPTGTTDTKYIEHLRDTINVECIG